MSAARDGKPRTHPPLGSDDELAAYRELETLFRQSPIPDGESLAHLSLFLTRSSLARILFMDMLYRRILKTHGVVMEFGVRWGRSLALFAALRAIYEPHNFSRRIIGFDTFEGFPSVAQEDGHHDVVQVGSYSVTANYEAYLERVLTAQDRLAPRGHLRKFELVKGDVMVTLERYLEEHPETVVAFAYFDMDLYASTRRCIELIKPHLTKGSVLGFDEILLEAFPGETVAVREVLGLANIRLMRTPFSHYQSYLVVE